MADITYCISECPFEDCERHQSKISKLEMDSKRCVRIADFAPTCRRYIASVVEEVSKDG